MGRSMPSWNDYIHDMFIKFGSELLADLMIELKNLKHLGSVQTYIDKFDELVNMIYLLEENIVYCFSRRFEG